MNDLTSLAQIRLTEFSHGGGCGCKIAPSLLREILRDSPATKAFPDLRVNNYLRATPIFIDGRLYSQNAHGLVVAFDGASGKTVWEQELFARTREEANGASTRGVDYWRGGAGNDKRIFAIRGEYLYALNADTGKPVVGFGDRGRASLHFDETEQPLAGRFNDSTE